MDEARQLSAGCSVLGEFNNELDAFLETLLSGQTDKIYNETRKQFAYWLNSAIKVLQKERKHIERNNRQNIKFDCDIIYRIQMCIDNPLEVFGLLDSFQNQLGLEDIQYIIKDYVNKMEEIAKGIREAQISERKAYKYVLNNDIDGVVHYINNIHDKLYSKTAELKKDSSNLLLNYKENLLQCFEEWVRTNSLKISRIINQYIIDCWNYRFSDVYIQPNLKRKTSFLVERMSNMDMVVYKEDTENIHETWENWVDKKLYNLSKIEKNFVNDFMDIANNLLAEYLKCNLSGIYEILSDVQSNIKNKLAEVDAQIKLLQNLESNYQQMLEQILSGYNE